ncbi:MAG: VWA domain-containing protein [Planctomycetes bacterium]|nr:VWA domain-containing protein [Planctomycetota bacterium]
MTDRRPIKGIALSIAIGLSLACAGCGEIAFVNAGVLGFAGAAAIPVILHLLFRRRPRRVKFPPIRFILRSKKATSRRFKLKHLMLLLARMLIIALFVLILSRPYVRSEQKVVHGKARVKAVLLLDNSFSMGYTERKVSRLNQAKKLALQVMNSFDLGSEVAVISTSEVAGSFTVDVERVRQQIGDLPLTARADSCWAAVRKAEALLTEETSLPREVYVFSDMTKNAWPAGEKLKVDPKNHWCFVDVSGEKNENLWIDSLAQDRRTVALNKPIRITATVRGKSPTPRVIEFIVDGEKRNQQQVDLQSGLATCAFDYVPRQQGIHFGAVGLAGEDPLPVDNKRYFVLNVRPAAKVLCVSEDEADAFYLMNALDPTGEVKRRTVQPVWASPSDLMEKDLGSFQAVFLCNVAKLDAGQAAKIAGYVSGGGGLVILAGGRTDLKEFLPHDSGILPAGEMEVAEVPKGVVFQPGDYAHAILESFRGGRNGDLTLPRFHKYLELFAGAPESRMTAILPFSNGSPALLRNQLGSGKVLFLASSIAASDTMAAPKAWNDLPKTPCFVPFIHELLDYVARYAEGPADVRVGEPVPIGVAGPPAGCTVEVTPPGRARRIRVPVDSTTSFAVFRETREPGGYVAAVTSGEKERKYGFVANVDANESDLTRTDARAIADQMPRARIRFARGADDLRKIERELRIGRELGQMLLWPLLLLVLAEVIMGNTFYKD